LRIPGLSVSCDSKEVPLFPLLLGRLFLGGLLFGGLSLLLRPFALIPMGAMLVVVVIAVFVIGMTGVSDGFVPAISSMLMHMTRMNPVFLFLCSHLVLL